MNLNIMKIVERNSMFETNSSSTHTLAIRKCRVDKDIEDYINEHGLGIAVLGGQFGWEDEVYNDPVTKLSYLYSIICSGLYDEFVIRKEQMRRILVNAGFTPVFEEMRPITYRDAPDADTYVEPLNGRHIYVDHSHQWSGNFLEKVFEDEDLFLSFVFSPDSYIVTTNDNRDEDFEPEIPEFPETEYYYKGN